MTVFAEINVEAVVIFAIVLSILFYPVVARIVVTLDRWRLTR